MRLFVCWLVACLLACLLAGLLAWLIYLFVFVCVCDVRVYFFAFELRCLRLAEGVVYLHTQNPIVVHRDLKVAVHGCYLCTWLLAPFF